MSTRFQPTPRSYRDDAVLELADQKGAVGAMWTALRKFERALTQFDERNDRAVRSLRKAQHREDQLALSIEGEVTA